MLGSSNLSEIICRARFQSIRIGVGRRYKQTSKSSKAWLKRQANDPFTRRARDEGLPSRSYFKLEHMDQKQKLLLPGSVVVDLGASPGGWSLYAARKIGGEGILVSVDLLSLDEQTEKELGVKNPCEFYFYQGDFTTDEVQNNIINLLRGRRVDVILSDMASNFTGDQRTDALRTLALCEDALSFVCFPYHCDIKSDKKSILRNGGTFLCKYFSCGQNHEKDLMDAAKAYFTKVKLLKPPASRKVSSEKYLLASGFLGLS